MQTFSTELAEEILASFEDKGWGLYLVKKSSFGTIDSVATAKHGPVNKLEKDTHYVILPAVDNPTDAHEIAVILDKILKQLGSAPSLPHGPKGIVLESLILREEDVAILGDKGIEIALVYDQFMNSLNKYFDRTSKRQINYANIDSPIRDLIYLLNKVPFVNTIKCKSASMWNEEMPSKGGFIKADEGCCFVDGAYILFDVEQHSSADSFIADVENLVSNYSFAEIVDEEGNKKVVCDCSDITQIDKMQEEENPFVNLLLAIKYSHQTTKEKGRQRMIDFQEIRDELIKIAEKYIK